MAGIALRPVIGLTALIMRINRHFWLTTVFLAAILPLIVQLAFGQQMEEAARTRLLIGNTILGLMLVALRKPAMIFTVDRVFGYRDLVATTGVTRNRYLAASALDAALLSALPLLVVAAGVALGGVAPPASYAWLLPYTFGAVAFYACGLCLGAPFSTMPAIALATNLAIMLFVALCPLSYPAERVPEVIRPAVALLPPSLVAEGMAAAWSGATLPWAALLLLGAWTLALGALGLRIFPWTDR